MFPFLLQSDNFVLSHISSSGILNPAFPTRQNCIVLPPEPPSLSYTTPTIPSVNSHATQMSPRVSQETSPIKSSINKLFCSIKDLYIPVGYEVSVLPRMEDYSLMASNMHVFINTINIWRESPPPIIWDMSRNADYIALPHYIQVT